jgi:hypothetical protein
MSQYAFSDCECKECTDYQEVEMIFLKFCPKEEKEKQ